MSQTVEQQLLVVPLGTQIPTITLDGDAGSLTLSDPVSGIRAELTTAGDLTLGGVGAGAELALKNAGDTVRAELSGADGRLRLLSSTGGEVARLDAAGNLLLGSNGQGGDIELRDSAGVLRVELRAASQRLRIMASDGTMLAEIGPNGNLVLGGGGGADGDIALRDASGTNRIQLDAQNQLMRIRNADGQEVGRLGDNANLHLGGNGMDGDVVLRDGTGTNRLELDSQNQLMRIRNAAGQEVGRLGDNANLRLGGNDMDGDVDLYDGNGVRRLLLDANGHGIHAYDAGGHEILSFAGNSNLRMGTNGNDGDILLFPSSATSLSADADATIHLDANAGDIILRNADCAEEFDVLPEVDAEPGTVMALGAEGQLRPSLHAHERGVVGVVSGAGAYRPGIVLDRQRDRHADGRPRVRRPIALVGKVYVKVVDETGPIAIGDLLVPSSVPGHAMRAGDALTAFGSVIGKALAPHAAGSGLIPMVIALQ